MCLCLRMCILGAVGLDRVGAVVTAAEVPIPAEEDQRHEATAQ